MDEKKPDYGTDEKYEETTNPNNPPNAVLKPRARTGWLLSSVGTLGVIFLVAAAAFVWVLVRHQLGKDQGIYPDPQTAGTSGEEQARENTPGGFNPASGVFSTTREELKYRGVDEPRTTLPETNGQELTDARQIKTASNGSAVSLSNVTVERTEGSRFWIREGDVAIEVSVPGNMPTVKAGQRVDIRGTIESGGETPRIRASRIAVR